MTDLEYYGTTLDSAGHYFFNLVRGDFGRSIRRLGQVPFNPEGLPYVGVGLEPANGTVRFYNMAGFTICAIGGSPADHRTGSKSIFFVEEDMTREAFEERLKKDGLVMKIINKMSFKVQW